MDVELRRLRLPLRAPFRSSHGVVAERDVLLVRVGEGWAECVAPTLPTYTEEHVEGAHWMLREVLIPAWPALDEAAVGHRMAKAALRMAVLDDELRRAGRSLASHLGAERTKVPAGIAIGIPSSVDELVAAVGEAVDDGYQRVKLKIEPGWDVEPVRAVRKTFPRLAIQVDANGAYTEADAAVFAAVDDLGLVLIEQPFPADDLLGSAALARRLVTPVCLDESLTSAAAVSTALAMGACSVVNVKAGRVGGLNEAVRIHDLCLDAGVPMWVGGMSETGLGRAVNIALAALPGFTLVGDLSASSRWYEQDITEPFKLEDGCLRVPTAPPALRMDVVEAHTTSVEVVRGRA